MEDPSKYYNDFVGVRVAVPCKTWDPEYAANCFGADYETMFVQGEICKVKVSRNGKVPRFDINFADKPGDKLYVNFDLEYVLRYSDEVPLKYHTLKAEYIVKLSQEASAQVLSESQANSLTDEEIAAEVEENTPDEVVQRCKKRKAKCKLSTAANVEKQLKRGNDVLEVEGSDIDTDSEPETDELDEDAMFLAPENEKEEGEETPFTAENWCFMDMPTPPATEFLGNPGPKHTLPASAVPYQYFCLFVPVYFWAKWTIYTNAKAGMSKDSSDKKGRAWKPTCEAELKAWIASVLCWSMFKTMSFCSFYQYARDPERVVSWFPSFTRWQQMKRFFKVSNPETDSEHKEDKMWRIREFFDTFLAACKANYWPQAEIALDEAIKKFKGKCSFKQYIKNKPVRWGIKIFALCCSTTAYLFNAVFYLGKKSEDEADKKLETSATHQAVISLVAPLQGKNHKLFMDNYYTSIPLFMELSKMGFTATGTVRVNRKGAVCCYPHCCVA